MLKADLLIILQSTLTIQHFVNQNLRTASTWRDLYPFESHWAELTQGRLHYLDLGPSGALRAHPEECLLFVHGNPTWSFHWRGLIASLKDRYRCVAPDHLGCGLSDKPRELLSLGQHVRVVVELVERLDLRHITLVAQDWGGAIGLGAMLELPDRLKRVVLFNTGAFPPHYIPWRIRACRFPVLGRLAVQGGNLFSLAALRMTLARRRQLDPLVAQGYLAPYRTWHDRRAVYGFVRDIPTQKADPTWKALEHIENRLPTFADRPAMLVWGMRDWCFRPDCADRFRNAWPQADFYPLHDVGHWVLEDAPEEALARVEEFLERTGAKAVAPLAADHGERQ